MNSSRPQDHTDDQLPSLGIPRELFPSPIGDATVTSAPGSCNDEHLVRGLVSDAIRKSAKSREQIAEDMSDLLGSHVTKRALDSYTSESAEQNRFPMQYARAFCTATGDWRLLRVLCERSGYTLITAEQAQVYELGRQMLLQRRAASTVARLEKELDGGAL